MTSPLALPPTAPGDIDGGNGLYNRGVAIVPESTSKAGFVYILINPALPGMVKIGLTVGDSMKRALQLSRHTGVPQDFEVAYEELVNDCHAVENLLHRRFEKWRVSSRREFFRVPLKDAISALQRAAEEYPVDTVREQKVDILPQLEARLRRWLRRDLVGAFIGTIEKVVYLEQVFQPCAISKDLEIKKIALDFIGDDDDPDELMFEASRSVVENAQRFLTMDTFSIWYCTSLLNDEVEPLFRLAEGDRDFTRIPFAP